MQTSRKQIADRYIGYTLITFFLPITRLLGVVLKRNHHLNVPPKNILFIKILGLGSLIVALDSIAEIKKKYPDSKLILITDSNIAEGIRPFNIFDEIWRIKSSNFFGLFLSALKYLLKSWRLKQLWVVDLEVYSKLTTLFSLFTLAINRFGFQLFPVHFRKYINTHNIYFNQFLCLEDNYINMCQAVTDGKVNSYYQNPNIYSEKRVNESEKKYIAINNTCSDLALVRKMPDDLLQKLCAWILENTNYQIALLGAPADKETNELFIANKLTNGQKTKVINYAFNTSFETYYDFLYKQSAFVISIDSAPLHIAKKLGIPTISLWGPTNPTSYLKIREEEKKRHLFYYLNIPCSPCVHHTTHLPCGGNNICMKQMESKTILVLVQKLIEHIEQRQIN